MFNSFPSTPQPHYLARRNRSWSWFLASIRSAMQMYLRALSGEVTLISPKDGPRGGCDEFWNYVFPEIEANKDVLFITLIDIQNPFGPGILYWRKGDPPPTPPRGPAGPNSGPGGDGSGIVIRLPPSTRDPRNDVWNLAGGVTAATAATALLSGDVTAALLHGLPPAATIMKDGLSGLNAATSQGQFIPATSSDPWIGPIDSLGLGEQWPPNTRADSFGKEELTLSDASSPVVKSQGSVLSPRDEGSTCSLGLRGWEKMFELPWVTPPDSAQTPRNANGGSTFRLYLSIPPVGKPLDDVPMVGSLLSKILPFIRGTVLRVDVIQTRLSKTTEAVTYRLDVKVVNGDSKQVLASQSKAVDNGLKISVYSAELPTPMFVWWNGLGLLHFREGGAGQQWDSSDTSKCQVGAWKDDQRKISCTYTPAQ